MKLNDVDGDDDDGDGEDDDDCEITVDREQLNDQDFDVVSDAVDPPKQSALVRFMRIVLYESIRPKVCNQVTEKYMGGG
uniref:DNA topoisomerase (ATP-hydrolyzing) n=1 Tax=Angiostrongylus cantonensis TaxID=6313 RepID=A0A0K0D333_ANGCA